jgi:hypothetical protein
LWILNSKPLVCNKRLLSTDTSSNKLLHPYYVTGFVDAEGNFAITIYKDPRCKSGWEIVLSFSINLHKKDLALLNRIKLYMETGKIYLQKDNSCTYSVRSPLKKFFSGSNNRSFFFQKKTNIL